MNWIGVIQGVFYVVTGAWPLLNMASFLAVTGPKVDLWLVKTVALLLIGIGIALIVGSLESPHCTLASVSLGILTAAALATVDIYYALRNVIKKIYLVDAMVELLFIVLWLLFSWV